MLEEIENEPVSVGRIELQEIKDNPDIIREKVTQKIEALLERYGFVGREDLQVLIETLLEKYSCAQVLADFCWVNGKVSANLVVVEKPKE